MTKVTSFQADIRPLFTERDIQGMIKGFNLASYDDVKAHAAAIYDRIRGIGGAVMPPPPPNVHFVDTAALSYQIFKQRSASFEALVGDYSRLPRRYLPEDYLKEVSGLNVVKTIWAEFMSDDPIGEVRWALALSNEHGYPQGMIAQADFLTPTSLK
jgi:hypothetical protein